MEKESLDQKMEELFEDTVEVMREKYKRLTKSGCLELSEWEDNYKLPKSIMSALCADLEYEWMPVFTSLIGEVEDIKENIRLFL